MLAKRSSNMRDRGDRGAGNMEVVVALMRAVSVRK